MGHAHHFLSRLDRVSYDEVELSLGLYNNAPLVKYILARAGLPARAERVAISLDDRSEGPFLIVTREGRFVTCLGRGMRHEHPVVRRWQLDVLAERHEALRACLRPSEQVPERERSLTRIVTRVNEAGPDLSREEFLDLAPLQPLLISTWLRRIREIDNWLFVSRHNLRRVDRARPCDRDNLLSLWRHLWALKHFAALAGVGTPVEYFEDLPRESLERVTYSSGTAPGHHASLSLGAVGAWLTARFGRAFVPICGHHFERSESNAVVRQVGAELAAVAGAHPDLRDAVLAALRGLDLARPGDDGRAQREATRAHVLAAFERTDDLDVRAALWGARRLLASGHPAVARNGWRDVRDVPLDVAMPAAVTAVGAWVDHEAAQAELVHLAPSIARLRPEDLYLPERWLRELRAPWSPEDSMGHLRTLRAYYIHRAPTVIDERAPGRNDPCACGSGVKFKKCCAVAPRPAPPPEAPVRVPTLADGIAPRPKVAPRPLSVPPPAPPEGIDEPEDVPAAANDDAEAPAAANDDAALLDTAAEAANQAAADDEHAAA